MPITKFSWDEPESAYQSVYPFNKVERSESGHFREVDDTPGAERLRTQHRTGTYTEIRPDGAEVHKIVGNNYTIIAQNNHVSIGGFCTVTIEGDSVIECKGNMSQRVAGDYTLEVQGSYNTLVNGKTNMTSVGDMTFGIGNALGKIRMQAASSVYLNSDLSVAGAILADSVNSNGAVTAGTGIHAGVMGSKNPTAGISTLGGINAGSVGPTAAGVVQASVMVTAPMVIGTTMVHGAVLMDPEGGAPLIRSMYNSHIHIAPYGPTSPPTVPMIP